jgi:hypothetical protein
MQPKPQEVIVMDPEKDCEADLRLFTVDLREHVQGPVHAPGTVPEVMDMYHGTDIGLSRGGEKAIREWVNEYRKGEP